MMDFGYLGSSSNLSPLAPPFTLDRSVPKPYNETFVNFTDPPPAVPFSSSFPNWQFSSSSSSNPDFYSNSGADMGVDSIRTTYLSSENYYPYFGVSSISSSSIQMPPLNEHVATTPDAFPFPRYSGEIPTSHVESKTYSPSFVSPVVEGNVPPMVSHEPSYDLSTTSHMDGPSHVDYHQSLSSLKYKTQWGSYWDRVDRLADGEMSKQVEYDGSFPSMQTNGIGSYAYRGYLNQGASSTSEGFNLGNEAFSVPHQTCLNLLGGESNIATPITAEFNSKSFSTHGSSFTPYDTARTLGISTFPKSHANVQPIDSATTFLSHQMPYASHDQTFQQLNAGKFGSSITIKRPSPPLVIQSPSVGSNLRSDRKDHLSDPYISNIKGELPYKPPAEDVQGYLPPLGTELQHPDMSAPPYTFTSVSDRAKSISSVEGPVESLDRYYPALDSPCWKGVSSFRFSPFEDCGAVNPDHLVKKPESLGGLKLQQNQFLTTFGETNAKNSSHKAHENSVNQENGYVELGSLLCSDRLPNASSPVKVDNSAHGDGIDHTKMSSSNLDSLFDNMNMLEKDLEEASNGLKSCSDLRPSQKRQLTELSTEKDLELGFGVAEAELNCNDASSKLNVQKLIDTIHNLSKLLLLQCSEDVSALLGVGQEPLKLAMKNLDACVTRIMPNPIEESNLCESVVSGRPPVTKEAGMCQSFGNHRSQQVTKNKELSEKDFKKFTDLFSSSVDEDFEKNDKVTQAIKNAFQENFIAEEEMQSETLFYKNLWLEAEAALCSANFRARYERMKTVMDENKMPKTMAKSKVAESGMVFEKLYSEVFPDPSGSQKGNPIIEAFKLLHKSTPQDPSVSRTNETVDEADASFKARLNILKNRVPNQNSINAGEQADKEGDDAFAGEQTEEDEQTDEDDDAAFAETIKTVEKLLSSVDAEDYAMTNLTQKVPLHATGKTDDNVEARVMARYQMLKSRDLNAKSEKPGHQSEKAASSFSGEKNPWRVLYEDDIVDRPLSQYCKVSDPEQVIDLNNCASDDLVSHLGGSIRLGTSGWCDGSLSDWEDVVKDDHCR